ncbi:MAG TPA: 3-oxoacyl-ACP reductase family protein [Acidimicrobiia bacterium]|nr:3-oxoacyl-ACP reductase family protein [Acidimicrobiia bacterium]
MRLRGKTAFVTGGARGIGAAIVEILAYEGATVAVCDVDVEGARKVADETASRYSVGALAVEVDVSDRRSVVQAVETVDQELGAIDVLVNNAGIDVIGPFVESDEADWDRIIAVNLRGTINTCHVVLPQMIEREKGGVIVNTGSEAGRVGSSGEAVYSATKGGVIAFSKTIAREVVRYGIRVNCVSPGPTDTELLGQVQDVSPKLRDALERSIPMRRVAEPSDIASVVAFLASDDSGYMTGQVISVSGGLTMI